MRLYYVYVCYIRFCVQSAAFLYSFIQLSVSVSSIFVVNLSRWLLFGLKRACHMEFISAVHLAISANFAAFNGLSTIPISLMRPANNLIRTQDARSHRTIERQMLKLIRVGSVSYVCDRFSTLKTSGSFNVCMGCTRGRIGGISSIWTYINEIFDDDEHYRANQEALQIRTEMMKDGKGQKRKTGE